MTHGPEGSGPEREEAGAGIPDSEPDLAAALVAENRRRGVEPDAWTAGARWKREDDIPDEVYFRALEALGEAGP